MQISFSVSGVPPKKDAANSMWNKGPELARLKALRLAAHQALAGQPMPPGPVLLALRVWAPPHAGDRDNFITGLCDGLMPAHRRTPVNDAGWLDMPPEIHPSRSILFADDKHVARIVAERLRKSVV